MADIQFTEISPPSGIPAVNIYLDVDAYDLGADPMTVDSTATGYDYAGTPTVNAVQSTFLQAEYVGVLL